MAAVGFIGLGNIGKPMALRLVEDEATELWVYDVAPDPVAELVAAGANAAASVADLVAAVDAVSVMVRDDAQVLDVLKQILAVTSQRSSPQSSEPPLIVMVHSTVAPDTPAALAASADRHGVWVVDAPVSGGAMGAASGELAILVGGSQEAFTAVEPVLQLMGSQVVHAGPIGAGTRFKLARNLLHFVSFTAATEAQRLAEAAGLDLIALGKVVRHTDTITGGPGAILHRSTAAPIAADEFWHGIFSHVRDLGEKDLRYATQLADELGVDVPLAKLALDRLGPGLGLPDGEAE
jgi:3-hydroxyisobutyrate dehydrogenase